MRNLRYFVFATLIISLLALVPSAFAQKVTGTITGVVTMTVVRAARRDCDRHLNSDWGEPNHDHWIGRLV